MTGWSCVAAAPLRLARWTVCVLSATLAACASPPTATALGPWVSGRLQVRIDAHADQAARSVSAAFDLQGDDSRGELRLNTPLGTQLASARWSAAGVTLATPSGRQQFQSLDDLSREALGEALPLAALPDWVAGRPWPGASSARTPSGFEQLGWRVEVDRRPQGIIEARRVALPAVWLRVRLDGSE